MYTDPDLGYGLHMTHTALTTPRPTTAREVLTRAADVILTRGLAQATFLADDGRVCADGAIYLALGVQIIPTTGDDRITYKGCIILDTSAMSEDDCRLFEHAHDLLRRYLTIGLTPGTDEYFAADDVWGWSDDPLRTPEQVAEAFKRAADLPPAPRRED